MATRPAPRYAKDPVALAKLRRERAFSSPAPKVKVKAKPMSYNRFGSNRIPNRELDTPTRVFGEVAKAVLPDPATLKRAAMDPTGTAKGAVEVASLASPIANAYRAYKFLSGDGVSVTGADMSDVEQALEVAGLYPGGKAATIPFRSGAKIIPRVADDIAVGGIRSQAQIPKRPIREITPEEIAYNERQAAIGTQQAETLSRIDVPFQTSGNPATRTPNLSNKVVDPKKGSKIRRLSDALKSPVVKVQKARAAGEADPPKITGQQQRAYEHGTLILRTERANARARDKGDTGVLEILGEKGGLSAVTKKEFDRLTADAKRNYSKIWEEQGIEGFDFSHRTALGTPDNVSNVWSNIELLPRKVNVDQGTAPWSVFRLGSPDTIKAYGGQSRGTQTIIPRP